MQRLTDINNVTYTVCEKLFTNKVVVITGGTSGIGLSVADNMLASGANVVVIGRSEGKITEIINRGAKFVSWDLSDLRNIDADFQRVLECFGKIDVWVNCAGYISSNDLSGDFFHATENDWQRQMDINCKALYFLSQKVGKYYCEQNIIHGHIVNVLSIDGIRDTWQPYGISKRVAIEFTKGIAKTLAPFNIVVNGIAPGAVHTEMISGIVDADSLRKNSVPNQRMSTPEEIANICCFLASDMANHMIGSIVICDGGDTLI